MKLSKVRSSYNITIRRTATSVRVPENGVGVFNGDEPLLWNIRSDGGHKKYYYGVENRACDVLATDIQAVSYTHLTLPDE